MTDDAERPTWRDIDPVYLAENVIAWRSMDPPDPCIVGGGERQEVLARAVLAQHEEIEKTRAALKRTLDAWRYYEGQGQVVGWDELHRQFGLDPNQDTFEPKFDDL